MLGEWRIYRWTTSNIVWLSLTPVLLLITIALPTVSGAIAMIFYVVVFPLALWVWIPTNRIRLYSDRLEFHRPRVPWLKKALRFEVAEISSVIGKPGRRGSMSYAMVLVRRTQWWRGWRMRGVIDGQSLVEQIAALVQAHSPASSKIVAQPIVARSVPVARLEPNRIDTTTAFDNDFCTACGVAFKNPSQRFCGKCGTPRAD